MQLFKINKQDGLCLFLYNLTIVVNSLQTAKHMMADTFYLVISIAIL